MEREKFDHIEERLKAIEGSRDYAFVDMVELCLVLDFVIPPKLKVSDFNKYRGTTYPKNHLKMYNRKMGAYSKNEKLLMHFFQESLTGAAVTWYTNLIWLRIECSYRTCARKNMKLSKNMPKGGGIWQLK